MSVGSAPSYVTDSYAGLKMQPLPIGTRTIFLRRISVLMCHCAMTAKMRQVVWEVKQASGHVYRVLCVLNAVNMYSSWQMLPTNEMSGTTASAITYLALRQLLRSMWSRQYIPKYFVTVWLPCSLNDRKSIICNTIHCWRDIRIS